MKTKSFSFNAIVIIVFILSCHINSFAQKKGKAFEITTSTFDQFKIRYKFGNENHMFRISATYLSATTLNSANDPQNVNFGAGVGFGVEFSKKLIEKMSLIYGLEFNSNFFYQKQDSNKSFLVGGYGILGLRYHLNEVVQIGAEINPGIHYHHSKTDFNSGNSLGFGIDNNRAEIVLGFSF